MSDQTRRHWLITISATVGIAGRLESHSGQTSVLPPGVYNPSSDQLSHALMITERYHPIPPGCPTEYVRPRTGSFEPRFFSQTAFPIIRRVVQVLLGESSDQTESVVETSEWIDLIVSEGPDVRSAAAQLDPLQRALAVAYYGAARVSRVATEDPAKICQEGLEWVSSSARTSYGKHFLSLGLVEQTAIVRTMSEEAMGTPGARFFAYLRAETIKGFYTSRAGLRELDYKGNAFYARSPGCSA